MKTLRTTQEVAAILQVPVQTLYEWRTNGKGPKAYRVGRHLRYSDEEIERWLETQTR